MGREARLAWIRFIQGRDCCWIREAKEVLHAPRREAEFRVGTWYVPALTDVVMLTLFVVLHPYYKLDYIALSWGGAREQAEERAAGNKDAKNWQDEARKLVEIVVSNYIIVSDQTLIYIYDMQMEVYYKNRPLPQSAPAPVTGGESLCCTLGCTLRRVCPISPNSFNE